MQLRVRSNKLFYDNSDKHPCFASGIESMTNRLRCFDAVERLRDKDPQVCRDIVPMRHVGSCFMLAELLRSCRKFKPESDALRVHGTFTEAESETNSRPVCAFLSGVEDACTTGATRARW